MKRYFNALGKGAFVRKNWGFTQISTWVKIIGMLILALFLVLQMGCQPRETKWEAGDSFKTQIIVSKSIGTEFKQVELFGVMNKGTLAGSVVDFYFSPGDESGKLIGNKPLARFVEDDGVYIPADQISLQMVTLYYHLQELKSLEQKARFSTESILKWPRKVALQVSVLDSPEMKYDNAFYNSNLDALFFVPYKDTALPIPLNPGIIAHEHFHSLFAYQVLNPLVEERKIPKSSAAQKSVDGLYSLYVLKAINEGLADVWGWIYSNDPDFVALSLPKAESSRNLEKGTDYSLRVLSQSEMQDRVKIIASHCEGVETKCIADESYRLATPLARGFKAFAKAHMQATGASEKDVRLMLATKVLNINSDIQKSISNGEIIDLDKVVLFLEKQFQTLSEHECLALQNTASGPGVVKCNLNTSSSAQ